MKNIIVVVLLVVIAGVGYLFYRKQQAAQWNNRGVEALNAGRYAEAVEALEKAQSFAPSNAHIQKNLKMARENTGTESAPAVAPSSPANASTPSTKSTPSIDPAALRERAAARVERMKAEGWKPEPNVTKADILDAARATEDLSNTRSAIVLLERALFLDPDDLEIERRIERLEARAAAAPSGQ